MNHQKLCPFCGEEPETMIDDNNRTKVFCKTQGCYLWGGWIPEREWEKRPIEDALRQQLAQAQSILKLAQAEIDVLRKREAFGGWCDEKETK